MAKAQQPGSNKTTKRAVDKRKPEPAPAESTPAAVVDKEDLPPVDSDASTAGIAETEPALAPDDVMPDEAAPDTAADDSESVSAGSPRSTPVDDQRSIPERLRLEVKKRCIFVGVPIADIPDKNYATNRVEVGALTDRQKRAYGMLFHGSSGNVLDNGRTVNSPPDALRLFLELLADAADLPKAHARRA